MKNIINSVIAIAFVFSACNSNTDKEKEITKQGTAPAENKSDTLSPTSSITASDFSIKETVNNYLKLKNALTNDDAKSAAEAGNAMVANLNGLDPNSLPADQKKAFLDVADDAKEHAEHIGANASKLEHQREHFAMLSKDVNDLINSFGAGQKLYQDFCPMYNDGKGGLWISEIKEIKNPYYGSKMLTCGSVKKEW
jgi:hypothetical protein